MKQRSTAKRTLSESLSIRGPSTQSAKRLQELSTGRSEEAQWPRDSQKSGASHPSMPADLRISGSGHALLQSLFGRPNPNSRRTILIMPISCTSFPLLFTPCRSACFGDSTSWDRAQEEKSLQLFQQRIQHYLSLLSKKRSVSWSLKAAWCVFSELARTSQSAPRLWAMP